MRWLPGGDGAAAAAAALESPRVIYEMMTSIEINQQVAHIQFFDRVKHRG